jgi:hypothetical protein
MSYATGQCVRAHTLERYHAKPHAKHRPTFSERLLTCDEKGWGGYEREDKREGREGYHQNR